MLLLNLGRRSFTPGIYRFGPFRFPAGMNRLHAELDCLPVSDKPTVRLEILCQHSDSYRVHASCTNPAAIPLGDDGKAAERLYLTYHFGKVGELHRFSHPKTCAGLRLAVFAPLTCAVILAADVELLP